MSTAIDEKIEHKQVLLVEDSSVTKDLVELVLTQSGHTVTSVDSGRGALEALSSEDFDVVLVDFHLPDLSGLDVVRQFVDRYPDKPRPLFIAITADTRGLLGDTENCELFDRVAPKPLDVDLVCDLVLEPPRSSQPVAPAARQRPDHVSDGLGLALMEWPRGPGPDPLPGLTGIDAILVREARDLDGLWGLRGANLLPILDETGQLGASADIDVSAVTIGQSDEMRRIVEQFHERRADLHPDLIRSEEPADRLLARIEIAGGALEARLSHEHDGLVAWNTICDPGDIPALLAKLEAESLIVTRFFERVHTCPNCGSARLIAREECPSCSSSRLTDESYLHHFRCATQAPESDFVEGDDLVCPKCRRSLHHFGRDYDRPGIMTRCESCQFTTMEPQVSFVCTRCTERTPAEAAPTHDVMSAKISEAGQTYLRSGTAFLGPGRRTLRFGDFPLELVIELNRAAAEYNESRRPFTLASVRYERLDDVRRQHGSLQARDSRRLWLEALQQAMVDRIIVTRGGNADFFLLPGSAPDEVRASLDTAVSEANRTVRHDLRATLRLFGPEDITR